MVKNHTNLILRQIEDLNQLRVTYCKRKRGIIKKAIELSVLCDVNICLLIQDNTANKVVHFSSNKDTNLLDYFNIPQSRQFYSNADYERFGGRIVGDQDADDLEDGHQDSDKQYGNVKQVIRRIKRTSIANTLEDQRSSIPVGFKQEILLQHQDNINETTGLCQNKDIKKIQLNSTVAKLAAITPQVNDKKREAKKENAKSDKKQNFSQDAYNLRKRDKKFMQENGSSKYIFEEEQLSSYHNKKIQKTSSQKDKVLMSKQVARNFSQSISIPLSSVGIQNVIQVPNTSFKQYADFQKTYQKQNIQSFHSYNSGSSEEILSSIPTSRAQGISLNLQKQIDPVQVLQPERKIGIVKINLLKQTPDPVQRTSNLYKSLPQRLASASTSIIHDRNQNNVTTVLPKIGNILSSQAFQKNPLDGQMMQMSKDNSPQLMGQNYIHLNPHQSNTNGYDMGYNGHLPPFQLPISGNQIPNQQIQNIPLMHQNFQSKTPYLLNGKQQNAQISNQGELPQQPTTYKHVSLLQEQEVDETRQSFLNVLFQNQQTQQEDKYE